MPWTWFGSFIIALGVSMIIFALEGYVKAKGPTDDVLLKGPG